MRWWLRISLLGLILLDFGGKVRGQHPEPAAKQGGWLTDYQAARMAARNSGKPLFVVFRCQP